MGVGMSIFFLFLREATPKPIPSLWEVVGYYSNQRLLIDGQKPLDSIVFYKIPCWMPY